MKIRIDAVSDVGCVRTNNEDMALIFGEQLRDDTMKITFELRDDERFTAIVADGMGGYERGEEASAMATESFEKFLNGLAPDLDDSAIVMALKKWCQQINAEILAAASGSGMGTTFTGILTYGGHVFVVNIGDSRTYRLRYDYLKQLTTDHSERERMGDESVPSNLIYNALGAEGAFIDVLQTKIVAGDKFIVCSDGLTDMIGDDTIEKVLAEGGDAEALVTAAKEAGGLDNITVIIMEVAE